MYPTYPYYSYKKACKDIPVGFPPQTQDRQPGLEYLMEPLPIYDNPDYCAGGKLRGKTALISGGDSGIGRAVAVAFAKEGANVAIAYLDEVVDAEETRGAVERYGVTCLPVRCDLRAPGQAHMAVNKTLDTFGGLDILVNNCAVQYMQRSILGITPDQLENTFASNIFSYFYLTQAALPHLGRGSAIINTTSVTAYEGSEDLIDYACTKGAIVAFTRSLALNLMDEGIRVNGVAPGPIWTALQPASYDAETVSTLGSDTPMGRAGQPFELAPAYVYLACDDSRYVSGQVMHVNGGTIVGS